MDVACTLCGKSQPAERIVSHGSALVCEQCVWQLVDRLESRGTNRPGSITAPRAIPCSLCDRTAEHGMSVREMRVCPACTRAIGHLVLSSARHEIEAIWGIEFEENTGIRQMTAAVAAELPQGGRTHAQLALDLADAGDHGQALIEAAIAIVSDPEDRATVERALGVLLGLGNVETTFLRLRSSLVAATMK